MTRNEMVFELYKSLIGGWVAKSWPDDKESSHAALKMAILHADEFNAWLKGQEADNTKG